MSNNKKNINSVKSFFNNIFDKLKNNTEEDILVKQIHNKIITNMIRNIDVNNKPYAKSKYKKRGLLIGTKSLLKSIIIKQNIITIRDKKNLIKANIHNNGAIIRRKKEKYLTIATGGAFYKVKSVKIPKREFFPNANSIIVKKESYKFLDNIERNFK